MYRENTLFVIKIFLPVVNRRLIKWYSTTKRQRIGPANREVGHGFDTAPAQGILTKGQAN